MLVTSFVFLLIFGSILHGQASKLESMYYAQFSHAITDRRGAVLLRYPNQKGHYSSLHENVPPRLHELLLRKEDRFFYYHPGVNPFSLARAFFNRIISGKQGGGSTITQQLAKILLGNERERTLANKFHELLSTFALESRYTKEEILIMYENVAYFGNQAQGFAEGSMVYFGKQIENLTDIELLSLTGTLASPSAHNPWKETNIRITNMLAEQFEIATSTRALTSKTEHAFQQPSFFEITSIGLSCEATCITTLDIGLQETLRSILARHLEKTAGARGTNGAIVVIKTPENELLAMVGSPHPGSQKNGSEINMALSPRPIGSTIKPLLYLKGFETGLRPYSIVEDREYKYPIATGYPLYPKNFDGTYRGKITLHEALSNSLNVPSVKVLEHIGLENFYDFLLHDLHFHPLQELKTYQYGIALGGLEMDLLTLTHYFTIFTNSGKLTPLTLLINPRAGTIATKLPPQATARESREIVPVPYIELVNKILSDRATGVEQFGLTSNLNLTQLNYAVKTGTSRDFHDSLVIGYTPDFIIGVWLGNSENQPLKQISGQSGAGNIWHDAMEYLFTTSYNKKTPFSFANIEQIPIENSLEFGFHGENPEKYRHVLEADNLILTPHTNDTFEFIRGTVIPLEARMDAHWTVNGISLGTGKKISLHPKHTGNYEIIAEENSKREVIQIRVVEKNF